MSATAEAAMNTPIQPGDFICTRTNTAAAWLIRLGALIRGHDANVNHVVLFHHIDNAGIAWGIDANPKGVGWRNDIHKLANQPFSVDNRHQPKTPEQRAGVCRSMERLLESTYGWATILGDALETVGLPTPWDDQWQVGVPPHVVCANAIDWSMENVGLPTPAADMSLQPGELAAWARRRGWEG